MTGEGPVPAPSPPPASLLGPTPRPQAGPQVPAGAAAANMLARHAGSLAGWGLVPLEPPSPALGPAGSCSSARRRGPPWRSGAGLSFFPHPCLFFRFSSPCFFFPTSVPPFSLSLNSCFRKCLLNTSRVCTELRMWW